MIVSWNCSEPLPVLSWHAVSVDHEGCKRGFAPCEVVVCLVVYAVTGIHSYSLAEVDAGWNNLTTFLRIYENLPY